MSWRVCIALVLANWSGSTGGNLFSPDWGSARWWLSNGVSLGMFMVAAFILMPQPNPTATQFTKESGQ